MAVATPEKTRKPRTSAPELVPRRAYLPAAERRKSIIAAAQQVFARANLQGARTRDIAKAAEVNQATLFEHFDSKKALFHEAVVRPLIDAMRGAHERVEAYETAATPGELAGTRPRLERAAPQGHDRDLSAAHRRAVLRSRARPQALPRGGRPADSPARRSVAAAGEGRNRSEAGRPVQFRHALRRGDGSISRRRGRGLVRARKPIIPSLDIGLRPRERQGNETGEKANGSATGRLSTAWPLGRAGIAALPRHHDLRRRARRLGKHRSRKPRSWSTFTSTKAAISSIPRISTASWASRRFCSVRRSRAGATGW